MMPYWKSFTVALIVASSSLAAATTVPAKLEAEAYANMAGVQLEACSEGTQNVGWIDTGDWMTYQITVPSAGSYTIHYRVASPNSGAVLSADFNAGANQLGTIAVPNTGGWQNWTTISQTVNLPAGTYYLGVAAKVGGFNLNWMNIVSNTPNRVTNLRIMPIGDSITAGYLSSNGTGYRGPLKDELASQGYSVDFAGSQRGGNMSDPDHEGHYGYRIDQIADLATFVLSAYRPNVVTLHVGTNDVNGNYQVSTAPSRLASLIDQVVAAVPDASVLVASLVPAANGTTESNIVNYNAQIPGIVQARANAGKHVYLVPMSSLTTADLADGLHPNDTGYKKMAEAFDQAIQKAAARITKPEGAPSSIADLAFDGYNNAFLVNSGGKTYYKKSINDGAADGTWVASLDILAAEDAYERTGRAEHRALVDTLCATWLQNTPMPWTWDGWNDDIGWFSLGLVRGYQMTGKTEYLTAARYGFDMAWARGWDTQYNGGGIWEQQPEKTPAGESISKEALSNDSLGKVACMIYQSTHDQWYLDRAIQIYDWVWNHIYNSTTGQINAGIDRNNVVNTGSAVYNQGTFVDFANLLYELTGNVNYYNDAKRSIDYVKNHMTNNGVISNSAGYLNTWGDEFARGLGHFVRDNRQWDTYYPWMVQNANAIWSHRRTDRNITWNGWAEQTPSDNTLTTSKFASAVAWMQFTPAVQPNNIAGVHAIVSKQSGIAIDNAGLSADGTGIIQWGLNYGQNQKWLFTQNEDTSWNIISLSSWKALDVPAGSTTNGIQMIQWTPNRNDNQRWWVDQQADGTYKIWNKATSGALDNSSSTENGFKLVQWGWNGGDQQRWLLK